MILFKQITILFFLYSISVASLAQAKNTTMSLNDAVMLALRNNPSVQSAELQRVIDKYSLEAAKWEFNVHYTLSGDINRTSRPLDLGATTSSGANAEVKKKFAYGTVFSIHEQNTAVNGKYNNTLNFSLTQPLWRGLGKDVVQAGLMTAKDQEQINKLNLRNTIISTITEVGKNYRSLVEAQNNLTIAKDDVKRALDTINQDKALIKSGRMPRGELSQANARLANAKVTRDQALNNLTQQRLNLLNILGLPAQSSVEVPTTITLGKAIHFNQQQAIQLALQNDEAYQSDLINIEIAKRNILVAKDNASWQLDASVTRTVDLQNGNNDNSLADTTAGLRFEIPIDDFPRKQAIMTNEISLRKDTITLAQRKRAVEQLILQNLSNLDLLYKQAQNSMEASKFQKQSYQEATLKKRYGRISMFELLSLQQDLNSALFQEVGSKIAYLDAVAEFQQIMGSTLDVWHVKIRY